MCVALATAAAIVVRTESAAVLAVVAVLFAATVIVSVRRSTSFLGGMGSVGDVLVLSLQLLLTASAVYAAGAAVWQLLGAGNSSGTAAEAAFTAGQLSLLSAMSAAGSSYCAPPLLSRRVLRAPLRMNTLATVTTWTCAAIAAVAVLGSIIAAVGNLVNAATVSVTVLLFLVGIGAIRLRSLHTVCDELAAALDDYYIELTAVERDEQAERRCYLKVERAALARSYGTLLPGFRGRTDKATRLGIMFIGAAVTGIDTAILKDHVGRLLSDLGESADPRLEAAQYIRDLRSTLIRDPEPGQAGSGQARPARADARATANST